MKDTFHEVFINISISLEDLYLRGILHNQSYVALSNFGVILTNWSRGALINLLFEELIDPITYDHFKDYSRIKSNRLYGVLNSMG